MRLIHETAKRIDFFAAGAERGDGLLQFIAAGHADADQLAHIKQHLADLAVGAGQLHSLDQITQARFWLLIVGDFVQGPLKRRQRVLFHHQTNRLQQQSGVLTQRFHGITLDQCCQQKHDQSEKYQVEQCPAGAINQAPEAKPYSGEKTAL